MTRTPFVHRSTRALGAGALLVALAFTGACRGWSEVEYATPFPERMPIVETLSIQVVRDGTHITMTNTTATSIPESRMWLNKWFSRPVARLDVGETVTFNLHDFRDEFSEPFRGGGFWATTAGDAVVTAHIEIDGRLHGLVVVSKRGG
ncbi:MAG: hypothetical protein KF684_04960 [Phycisphaeraceae bacterium]|nr:hypothetical protein [Phycisphaeraceae bacterium]